MRPSPTTRPLLALLPVLAALAACGTDRAALRMGRQDVVSSYVEAIAEGMERARAERMEEWARPVGPGTGG